MKTFTSINRSLGNRRLARILCFGLLIHGFTGCKDSENPRPGVGDPFPLSAFEQMPRIGKGDADIEGKTLLINFWATWCAPCRKEMPGLQKLNDDLDPKRFVVIGVSVDEDSNLIREFMLQHEINFPNFQDEKFRLASGLLGITSYPETFIVSPRGVITRRISEALPQDLGIIEQSLESGGQASTSG